MVIKRELCTCGHNSISHPGCGECTFCDCKKYEFDRHEARRYIRDEIDRRKKQIQDYIEYEKILFGEDNIPSHDGVEINPNKIIGFTYANTMILFDPTEEPRSYDFDKLRSVHGNIRHVIRDVHAHPLFDEFLQQLDKILDGTYAGDDDEIDLVESNLKSVRKKLQELNDTMRCE